MMLYWHSTCHGGQGRFHQCELILSRRFHLITSLHKLHWTLSTSSELRLIPAFNFPSRGPSRSIKNLFPLWGPQFLFPSTEVPSVIRKVAWLCSDYKTQWIVPGCLLNTISAKRRCVEHAYIAGIVEPIHTSLGGGSALIVLLATSHLLQQGHPPTSEQEVHIEVYLSDTSENFTVHNLNRCMQASCPQTPQQPMPCSSWII